MQRWILLCLVATLSLAIPPFPASASPQAAEITTVTRDSIVARAKEMVYGQWVSPVTVYADQSATPKRWGTFYAGTTYTGMAYTQNNPQESWATFATNMQAGVGKPGVDQGTDCSGFASFAWQIPRQTTNTFIPNGYAYQLSSFDSLLPGDALLRAYDHIGIYYDRLESGNFIMLEQTDPRAIRSEWTYSYASTYKPVRRYGIASDASATSAPAGTFVVEYYPNQTLSGRPVFTRKEVYPLSHDWGTGGPGGGVPNNGFSLRASGKFYFGNSGVYTFNVASDDGVRVWLDGVLIEDHWFTRSAQSFRSDRYVSAGLHTIRVEYYESTGSALVHLRWWRTRTCPDGQFLGEYFSNSYLGGVPAVRTCEAPINNDWRLGSPDPVMPKDNFSARWEGKFGFQARPYTFIVRADDGVRVWVDDVLIIDQWKIQAPTEYRVTRTMTAGTHTVLVRYFEASGGAVAQVRWE